TRRSNSSLGTKNVSRSQFCAADWSLWRVVAGWDFDAWPGLHRSMVGDWSQVSMLKSSMMLSVLPAATADRRCWCRRLGERGWRASGDGDAGRRVADGGPDARYQGRPIPLLCGRLPAAATPSAPHCGATFRVNTTTTGGTRPSQPRPSRGTPHRPYISAALRHPGQTWPSRHVIDHTVQPNGPLVGGMSQ